MARIKYYNTTTQEWEYADGLRGGGIPEAPIDGKQYARKDGEWTEVQSGEPTVTVEPADDDIPRLFVWGSALPTTKTDTNFEFKYISDTAEFNGYCTLKCQGNSSMSYAKKNFTIKLFSDSTHETKLKKNFKGWGKQNKFVLKANFIDHSHSRNIISANVWEELVKTRSNYAELPAEYKASPHHGVVDGFPFKLYANGTYQGIYTWNIPKDKWMADMDDELDTNCILCGENYVGGCFRGMWSGSEATGWTDEIHDVVPQPLITRWNEIITFVQTSSNAEFKANLSNYFDVESLIDYYLFGIYSTGLDAFGKNQIYLTYDGQIWYASPYDMDSTWGLYYNGNRFVDADYARTEYEDYVNSTGNLLYVRLEELFAEEIKARKAVIRQNVITESNLDTKFENWWYNIGTELLTEDGNMWNAPSKTTNNVSQLRNYVRDRLIYSDGYIESLVTPIPCTGITLDRSSIAIDGVGSETLTATPTPSDTTDAVVWTSSDDTVATVNNGVVTSVANGTTTITATCGSYSATCAVTVTGISGVIPCTAISLDQSTLTFSGVGSQTLTATPTPSNTTDVISWASSDITKATVENGVVTAVANGTVTITVTCGTQTATCSVSISGIEEIDYDLDPFAGVTWLGANTDYNRADGATTKTQSNQHASETVTCLQKCQYLFTPSKVNVEGNSYGGLFIWANELKYGVIKEENLRFIGNPNQTVAMHFYNASAPSYNIEKPLMPVNVETPSNETIIDLSTLTISDVNISGNNVNVYLHTNAFDNDNVNNVVSVSGFGDRIVLLGVAGTSFKNAVSLLYYNNNDMLLLNKGEFATAQDALDFLHGIGSITINAGVHND